MAHANDLVAVGLMSATAWLLLEMALKGAAVLAAGAVCAILAHRAPAAVRHLIWTVTLTGALIAPVVGILLPQWRIPVPGWAAPVALSSWGRAQAIAVSSALPSSDEFQGRPAAWTSEPADDANTLTAAVELDVADLPDVPAVADLPDVPAVADLPDVPAVADLPDVPAVVASESSVANHTGAGTDVAASSNALGTVAPWIAALADGRERRSVLLVVLWVAGMAVALIPPLVGALRVSALLRRARPMRGGRWALLAPSALREIDVRRRVRFLELDEPVMPMTWGAFRPVVLLPAGDFDSTISQRLDVLRHELAHVRRYDCLTQLIAQLACAVNWYNPLAWLAAREMRVERERACDDEVLRAGTKASDYADYLLRVARETRMSAAAFGALAMARPSQLSVRLRAVLADGRRRERASSRVAACATIGAALVVAAVGMITPEPAAARGAITVPQAITVTTADIGFRSVPAAPDAPAVPFVPAVAAVAMTAQPIVSLPTLAAIVDPGSPAIAALASFPSTLPATAALGAADCERNSSTRGKSSHTNWTSSENGSKRWRVVWSEGDCSYEVEARGEIRYNRDVTDVESISSGGSFTLEQHIGDDTRRLTIRPRPDGSLDRVYSVNGDRREYDETARAWFAEALIALDRRTAFAVDQRVPAILQSGGVDAVLREISLLDADYARRRYYTKLLSMRQLDRPQVRRVVEQAGAEMSSDYELAELLLAVAKLDAFGDDSHVAFVGAVKKIDSDYERRRALNALLKRDRLAPATVEALLEAASTIGSDYELAELLIDVSKQYAINDRTRPMYIRAVGSIESDYEHRRVLSAVIAGGGITSDVTRALLEDARRISSDYELAEFLVAISRQGVLDASTSSAYFAAADKIKSDYEHRRAIGPLLKRDVLTKEIAKGILASAARIDSDYECAELLVALASVITIDQDLRPAFDRAADTIKGEYEYGRAMAAVRRSATR